ncbi:MAG: hypothetical protein GWO20_09695, partial [Candidatus Korarchaeota archaeon]|nr:hypothetical protein [Candidatus Korarchaeota archaeon]NIU83748.1 hypothetical protein [Candidatus Thorarchaeota archaeon]NIW15099.1 hypothetical protein [Candidatus Thorarchaeota archaeon]NIW52065.1 hypothetical protein [Candidatus Korarchaeota archaeon]
MNRRKEHKKSFPYKEQSRGDTDAFQFTSEMLITYNLRKKDYIVIVDTKKAEKLYQRAIDPASALASEDVFRDIEQGKKASRTDLEEVV